MSDVFSQLSSVPDEIRDPLQLPVHTAPSLRPESVISRSYRDRDEMTVIGRKGSDWWAKRRGENEDYDKLRLQFGEGAGIAKSAKDTLTFLSGSTTVAVGPAADFAISAEHPTGAHSGSASFVLVPILALQMHF